MRVVWLAALLVGSLPAGVLRAQSPGVPGAVTGDPARGKSLYERTYRCYACHGFDGQSGSPRLVPVTRTQSAFSAFVRKPSSPAMPSFADAPLQDLDDVYAYIRSLPATAPPVERLPVLRDILERRTKLD